MAGAWRVHGATTVHRPCVTRRLVLRIRHRIGVLCGRISLRLGLLRPLLAQCFSLLLLLCSWRRRPVQGASLEVHWRDEGTGEFGLGNEWVKFRLLGRPPLQGIDGEQTSDEVYEGDPVVHFY